MHNLGPEFLPEPLEIRVPPSIAKQPRHVRIQRIRKELSLEPRRVEAKVRPCVLHHWHQIPHGESVRGDSAYGSVVLRGRLYPRIVLEPLSFRASFVWLGVGVWPRSAKGPVRVCRHILVLAKVIIKSLE